ncbi:hypothetical protein XO12_09670 [Marinitoga sp. 1154]|uniref:hypothetical protein n=1 Tax=Marinitoga sp. 1154 TaxID=1643335 RepID=UPI001586002E|nr:hypothetical protein [Marinitoga sp. 1154]NUV00342.1 hypothetical protein [Marinitoga sp. 1154]
MKINNMFLKDIIDIIEYGSFSIPIVNYVEDKIDNLSLKYYFSLLKSKWKMDLSYAIEYANKVISTTTTTILRELARYELILIYSRMKNFDKSKEIFDLVKKNISNLSPYARKIIIPGLKALAEKLNQDFEVLKCYGDSYEESYVQKAIIEYSKARKLLSEGKYNKAYDYFINGFLHAKRFNHPAMICAGLNSATWWIRKINKKKALYTANLLEYYTGYYFEDFNYISNWLDTIINVKQLNNDIRVLGLSKIIYNALIIFPDLKILLGNIQYPDFKIEEYTLNKRLYYFIYKKSKKRLRTKSLNVIDLKKFIQKYGLTYKKTYPFEIKNELYKMHINKTFKENIIKFKNEKKIKIPELFFETYTALIEKPYFTKSHILRLIFKGDKDKIIKYFSRDYEKMHFFNIMLSDFDVKEAEKRLTNSENFEERGYDVSPFFIARKKLITELLKNMKNFKEFILHYFDLSDEEMKIFDVFLRNCVRYDIKWPITPYPKGKIRDFAIKYGLGQKRVALGYYSFEYNERILIDEIIDKFL